jgi:hypothetical protein
MSNPCVLKNISEKEYSETLAAIEKVQNLLDEEVPQVTATEKPLTIRPDAIPPSPEYGSLTDNVKKALPHMPKVFDKNDILAYLGYEVKENSMDSCLRRLVKQGIIEVHVPGQGRRATKYKLKKTDLGFD